MNKDGKLDFIVGNEGLNNQFRASKSQPIQIHFDDFDKNGAVDYSEFLTHALGPK